MANHLRFAELNEEEQRLTLTSIIKSTPALMTTLKKLKQMQLHDSWIVSGAIYNQVWNRLTGKPDMYGVKDIDIFYWDEDTSWEAEDQIIKWGDTLFDGDPPIEIRNQARVPLWYKDHFGHDFPNVSCCKDTISLFAAETHSVAARLGDREEIEIFAPFGFKSIFSMTLVPNIRQPNRETHEKKSARQKALWPELTVIPWPE